MSYLPKPEIEQKAISYLMGKSKIRPIELVDAIGIHRNTAPKLCNYLHAKGKLLRDGRTYTWNPIDEAAAGRIFQGRSNDLLVFLDNQIASCGEFNRGLANAYRNGDENSCFTKRRWADTLQKSRTRLLNCLTVQNWALLVDIEREIALDVPDFMGLIYSRSEYAQDMLTAERKMAYAARKPRTSKDDAFHAERQAKVDAKQRAAKAAWQEADRLLQAQAETMLAQMGALADPVNVGFAMTVLQDLGTEKAKRFSPATEPVQPESCPDGPIIPSFDELDIMEAAV
jgi:hypothetical protein